MLKNIAQVSKWYGSKLKRHPYTKPFLFSFIHVAYVGLDIDVNV